MGGLKCPFQMYPHVVYIACAEEGEELILRSLKSVF